MPIAYEWMKSQRKLTKIYVECEENSVIAKLTYFGNEIKIEYEKAGHFSATVECKELKKEDLVERNVVDAFCEDLKELLTNQKDPLNFLRVSCSGRDPVSYIHKVIECTESALKSRDNLLQVKSVSLISSNLKESVNIVSLLDPSYLSVLCVFVKNPDYEELLALIDWKKGSPLRLNVIVDSVSMENLVSIRKLLPYSSTFDEIYINYNSIVSTDLQNIFKPFVLIQYGNLLQFLLERSPENPGASENSLENLEGLSIKNNSGLNVLANRLAMKVVLKELDCFDVQSLRRVSYHIRSCVDHLNPEPHIEMYSLFVKGHKDILMNIELKSGQLKAMKYPESSKIWRMEEDLANEIFRSTVVNDFEVNLKNQKSCMRELKLEIDKSPYLAMIGEILKNRSSKLSAEVLIVQIFEAADMMGILPYLDPTTIKSIELLHGRLKKPLDVVGDKFFSMFAEDHKLELDEILKLDQWKNLEHLIANKFVIENPIQEIGIDKFSTMDIIMKRLSNTDVLFLKNELLKSSKFQKFKIVFFKSSIDETLYNLMDPVFQRASDVRSIWYFRMQIPEYFLHIVYHIKQQMFIFSRVNSDSVPLRALVLNVN